MVHCDVYIHDIHVYVYLHGSTSRHMDAYLCFSALRVTWFLSIPFIICIYLNPTKLVTKPRNNQTLNLRFFRTKTRPTKKNTFALAWGSWISPDIDWKIFAPRVNIRNDFDCCWMIFVDVFENPMICRGIVPRFDGNIFMCCKWL